MRSRTPRQRPSAPRPEFSPRGLGTQSRERGKAALIPKLQMTNHKSQGSSKEKTGPNPDRWHRAAVFEPLTSLGFVCHLAFVIWSFGLRDSSCLLPTISLTSRPPFPHFSPPHVLADAPMRVSFWVGTFVAAALLASGCATSGGRWGKPRTAVAEKAEQKSTDSASDKTLPSSPSATSPPRPRRRRPPNPPRPNQRARNPPWRPRHPPRRKSPPSRRCCRPRR
jgi:hypothetical protein